MPIVKKNAARSDQRVERTLRSFVHSESATRACVTRPWRRRGSAGDARSCGRLRRATRLGAAP